MKKIGILDRNNLLPDCKLKPTAEVGLLDFGGARPECRSEYKDLDLLVFKCTLEKKIKIFKNRIGKEGIFDLTYLNILLIGNNT